MGKIEQLIHQGSFADERQKAIVSLLVVSARLRLKLEDLCMTEGITLPQFNILRILKGVHPEAHPRSEIRKRMVDKSDVTRLIDRLEKAKLVKRLSASGDQRQSMTTITKAGLHVLDKLNPKFERAHTHIAKDLSPDEITTFTRLLQKINL